MADYEALGVSEKQYREYFRNQLLRQKLADAIAEEQELPTEADHSSFFIISFATEEEANEAAANIAATDFLTVWNEIKSTPLDPEAVSTAFASELMWQTEDSLATNIGADVANAVFSLEIGDASEILVVPVDAENSQYILVMVSGREERPLTEAVIQQAKATALTSYIDTRLTGALNLTGYDEGRTPTTPRLDPKFLVQPTPVPEIPDLEDEGETGN